MKKLLLTILATISLYAEASFDQVQTMIDKQEYKQAKLALTVITQNHPDSAKAFYSLAQANAGIGDLIAAQAALDKAQALNPTLSFVPQSQVDQLKQAIQPQAKLIKPVPTGPSTLEYLLVVLSFGIVAYLVYRKYSYKPKSIREELTTKYDTPKAAKPETFSEPKRSYSEPESATIYTPRSYDQPRRDYSYSKPVREIHHYHTASQSPSTLETIAVAGIASAAVSSMMNNTHHNEPSSWEDKPTHSYEPEPISTTWDEPTTNSSWEDSSSSSSSDSWSDSSSSSDSSWSDSSSSSSSSSWSE